MSIQCDCSIDYDSSVQTGYFERTVRSREDRKCCECGEVIPRGTQHEWAGAFLVDGGCWRARTCLPCVRIRETYCPGGWIFGNLAEQIEECIGFDYREMPDEGAPYDPIYDGDVPVGSLGGTQNAKP